MINFSLIGAGRIGKMHAKFIAAHPNAKLKYIYDVNSQFAKEVAKSTGCSIASTAEEAINSDDIDAVLIASATPTHTQFITIAAKAGKAIFCEKPIDLDINKVNECMENIKGTNVPIQIGFNRRFDASHAKAQQAREKKEIGEITSVIFSPKFTKNMGFMIAYEKDILIDNSNNYFVKTEYGLIEAKISNFS